MQTFVRKKLEIIVEAPHLKRVEQLLDGAGVRVYTVFDGREGKGLATGWTEDAEPHDQRLIVAICSADAAEAVFQGLSTLFQRYPGVVYASDVEVLRAERF